jgi:alginate O-acetyltransferase complex protein AlgI
MIGVVFMLHFGVFELLALFWRSHGIPVQQVMQKPLLAASTSEFWGKRWNTAFNDVAFKLAFRPIARRLGGSAALMVVFLLSGLVHELVISFPARGGYGLPTAYFLLQGAGVMLERKLFQGSASRSPLNRLFTLLMVAGPAGWLFPRPFIHNVILPMLRAFGGK